MPNIRRGTGPSAARANGARIDSRNGSASATPAPRRNRRREIGRRVEANGAADVGPVCVVHRRSFLLVPEQLALHDRVDDAAHAVLAGLRRVEDLLDLVPVGEPHRRPRGEDRQLPDQVPRDRHLVLQPAAS